MYMKKIRKVMTRKNGFILAFLLPGILPQKGDCRQAELAVPGGDPGDGRAEEIAGFPFLRLKNTAEYAIMNTPEEMCSSPWEGAFFI